MHKSFFHIQNALTTRCSTAYNAASLNDNSSLHSGMRGEMNNLGDKLTSLLVLDGITKFNIIPTHSECSITTKPNISGPFQGTVDKYTVKKGDNLSKICLEQTENISTNHLMLWNGLKNDTIKPGQELLMYNPNTHHVNIKLYYDDFLENILNLNYLTSPFSSINSANDQKTTTFPSVTKEAPTQNVVYDKDHPLNLPGTLPKPVGQEPGSYDCFFANLSWCDQYFGGNKNIEDFRKTFHTLFPKNDYGAVSNNSEAIKLAGSNFTYAGIFSEADFIKAIASGHPVITNGNYGGRAHSLIVKGLTFDKKGNINSYLIIDPDRVEPIYSLTTYDMKNNCILNIVITGKKP